MAHWSRPQTSKFLYSPSAAQVALMCTPCRRPNHKRVSRNHMAYPRGTFPGGDDVDELLAEFLASDTVMIILVFEKMCQSLLHERKAVILGHRRYAHVLKHPVQ